MAVKKRLENDSQILTAFLQRWLFPTEYQQELDFKSGLYLTRTLCQSLGLDADRVYSIEPGTYRGIFEDAEAVSAYLAGITNI